MLNLSKKQATSKKDKSNARELSYAQAKKVNKSTKQKQISEPMFQLPVQEVKDLIVRTSNHFVLLCQVKPINVSLLPDDQLSSITDSIQSALSSFEGRIGIFIQSETIDIAANLANIDKKLAELNSELKLHLLMQQREYMASMVSRTRNVLQFYVGLELYSNSYLVAEQLLEDAFNTFKNELEGHDLLTDRLLHDDIMEVLYKRMNPESSIPEPYKNFMSLHDIMPENAVLFKDGRHLQIENRFFRHFAITKLPQNLPEFRWLHKIFNLKGDINYSFILTPKNKMTIQKELNRVYERSNRLSLDENKKASELIDLKNEQESVQAMLEELSADNVSFYDVCMLISVSGKDQVELNTLCNSLRAKISSCYCMSTEIVRKEFDPWFVSLPIMAENSLTKNWVWNLSSRDIGSLVLFDSSEFMEESGVMIGENVSSGGVVVADSLNPNYNNGHMTILADTGFGKTFFLMCDATRNFPYVDYTLMFDLKGDLIFPWGTRHTFTPSSGLCMNPFHIRNAIVDNEGGYDTIKLDVGGYLQTKVMDLIVFFKWIIPDMTSYDESLLEIDIRDTYAVCGLNFQASTLPKVFCTLSDLERIQRDKLSHTDGMEHDRRQYLNACLKPYFTGAYSSMFNGQTNVSFDDLTVFNLANCPDGVKKPLYDLLLKDIWQFCKADGTKNPTRKRVYVDECHQFADPQNPQTLEFLSSKLSKQSRGFGVCLITATQNLPDFLSIPRYGQAIIDNSYFKLFGKLGESDLPVAQKLYRFSDPEMKILQGSSSQRKSGKGKGILVVGAQRVLIQTRASKFELEFIDPEQYEKIYGVASRFKAGKSLVEVM